jgi:hypothetical protein
VLQDQEEASSVLPAVYVDVTEFYSSGAGFMSDIGPESLTKSRFACTDITSYQNPLSHSFW